MTDIEAHLAAGYLRASNGGTDPALACAAEIPRPVLIARAAELQQVKDRCHISRVQLAFINRVLACPTP